MVGLAAISCRGILTGRERSRKIRKKGDFYDVTFAAPKELLDEMVVKGSVAVDGISLTVAAMDKESFSVAVIPVTWQNTTLGNRKSAQRSTLKPM